MAATTGDYADAPLERLADGPCPLLLCWSIACSPKQSRLLAPARHSAPILTSMPMCSAQVLFSHPPLRTFAVDATWPALSLAMRCTLSLPPPVGRAGAHCLRSRARPAQCPSECSTPNASEPPSSMTSTPRCAGVLRRNMTQVSLHVRWPLLPRAFPGRRRSSLQCRNSSPRSPPSHAPRRAGRHTHRTDGHRRCRREQAQDPVPGDLCARAAAQRHLLGPLLLEGRPDNRSVRSFSRACHRHVNRPRAWPGRRTPDRLRQRAQGTPPSSAAAAQRPGLDRRPRSRLLSWCRANGARTGYCFLARQLRPCRARRNLAAAGPFGRTAHTTRGTPRAAAGPTSAWRTAPRTHSRVTLSIAAAT